VFYEPLEGGGDARAAAQEIGGNILPLNPAASIISGEYEEETFILIMEKNLVNLKEGLECEMK
ncbi:zinc-binding protein, partial [Candidatus Micrarchaeota archaeon CG11_big_fil_rev_8_21_14_0_20_47_5]